MGLCTEKQTEGGSMSNGILLMFCIVMFTIAIMSIFLFQPKDVGKFDKQGTVKYNDNDY
jgi:flagellar basal body-associated protein FliL